jgi:hypothetical protein
MRARLLFDLVGEFAHPSNDHHHRSIRSAILRDDAQEHRRGAGDIASSGRRIEE